MPSEDVSELREIAQAEASTPDLPLTKRLSLVLLPRPNFSQLLAPKKSPDPIALDPNPILPPPPHEKVLTAPGLNRWVLGVCFVSVALNLGFWLGSRAVTQSTTAVSAAPTPLADRQFASYLQNSLDTLAVAAQPAPTIAANPAPVSPAGVQSVSAPVALPQIFVPPTLNATEQGTPEIPNPPDSVGFNGKIADASKLYIPVYGSPATVTVPANPSPSVPQVAPQSAPTITTTIPQTQPAKPLSPSPEPGVAAAPSRTLVGVMEMGERSIVLIELNGVTQRYEIGESIGSSGWILSEVAKNQAILNRNGEVRSVFLGQKF